MVSVVRTKPRFLRGRRSWPNLDSRSTFGQSTTEPKSTSLLNQTIGVATGSGKIRKSGCAEKRAGASLGQRCGPTVRVRRRGWEWSDENVLSQPKSLPRFSQVQYSMSFFREMEQAPRQNVLTVRRVTATIVVVACSCGREPNGTCF